MQIILRLWCILRLNFLSLDSPWPLQCALCHLFVYLLQIKNDKNKLVNYSVGAYHKLTHFRLQSSVLPFLYKCPISICVGYSVRFWFVYIDRLVSPASNVALLDWIQLESGDEYSFCQWIKNSAPKWNINKLTTCTLSLVGSWTKIPSSYTTFKSSSVDGFSGSLIVRRISTEWKTDENRIFLVEWFSEKFILP